MTMADVSTQAAIAREQVAALSEMRREPGWLRERRLQAWEAFERHEWPRGRWTRLDDLPWRAIRSTARPRPTVTWA